jgi:GT2 family glycosyltransferase
MHSLEEEEQSILNSRKVGTEINLSETQPLVSIVLLNWNNYRDTIVCIQSLKKIDYNNYLIVIVDNCSAGDDVKILRGIVPENVKIIQNPSNLGFTGGCNVGIEYSQSIGAEYTLLLNNDTEVDPSFLANLVFAIQSDQNVAIATPCIFYHAKPNTIWMAGGHINKFRASGVSNTKENNSIEIKKISFASGCCMLLRNDIIKKVGSFNEKFFAYVEDVELCLRVIKNNNSIIYVPQSRIYHKVNATSTGSRKTLPLYYVTRNRLLLSAQLDFPWYMISRFFVKAVSKMKYYYWTIIGKKELSFAIEKALIDYSTNNFGASNLYN